MNSAGISIQDFLQIYQASNAQFDLLLNLMGIFITAFGVLTAIVIGFFAIRQVNVDREIRKYRDEIKRHKEAAADVVDRMKLGLKDASTLLAEAKNTKSKLEEELNKPPSEETKKEVEKLQEKIEKLEEDIAYRRGALSASPSVVSGGFGGSVIGAYSDDSLLYGGPVSLWQEKCKKCDQTYDKSTSYNSAGSLLQSSFVGLSKNVSECPYCGNINGQYMVTPNWIGKDAVELAKFAKVYGKSMDYFIK